MPKPSHVNFSGSLREVNHIETVLDMPNKGYFKSLAPQEGHCREIVTADVLAKGLSRGAVATRLA